MIVIQQDAPLFVFNRQYVDLSGYTSVKAKFYTKVNDEYVLYFEQLISTGGVKYHDISKQLQSAFTDSPINVDYSSVELSNNCKLFKIDFCNPDNETDIYQSFQVCGLWGGLQSEQEFVQIKDIKRFGLPTCVSLYFPTNTTLVVGGQDVNFTQGLWNIGIGETTTITPKTGFSVFDYTFDESFGNGKAQDEVVISDVCSGSVYLRWVDYFGRVIHWSFIKSKETQTFSDGGVKIQGYPTSESEAQYENLSEYSISKTLKSKYSLGTGLINRDDFKIAKTVLSSPQVEMYISERWLKVEIDGKSIDDDTKYMQEFDFTLNAPEYKLQSL